MRVRYLLLGCLVVLSCAKEEVPVQDPLDYLRVGVDPSDEADAIIDDLRRNGFQLGTRLDEESYIAFDAVSGGESTVRVISARGVVLSLESPDVRWPARLSVELASGPRPDFNLDGQRDVIVALRERDRTCLAWAQVDQEGFATEVFRPRVEWGESPCVVEIHPDRPELMLEVSVPDGPGTRVRVPLRADGTSWNIDDSARASAFFDAAVEQRTKELEVREMRGEQRAVGLLRAELTWLERLRAAPDPVLEPADDGEEAR